MRHNLMNPKHVMPTFHFTSRGVHTRVESRNIKSNCVVTCGRQNGRPTYTRITWQYRLLLTRYMLLVCALRLVLWHSSHPGEVRALVRTPPGQMSTRTPLIIHRQELRFLNYFLDYSRRGSRYVLPEIITKPRILWYRRLRETNCCK